MEDLIVRLRIKEDNQKGEKSSMLDSMDSKANLVEGESSKVKSKSYAKGNKWTTTYNGSKDHDPKRIKGSCWVCRIPGHRASDCRHNKSSSGRKGKEMTLLDVLHVLKICKNLMSKPLLSKKGF